MKFYTDKPVTPQSIALWFGVCLLGVFLCGIGWMRYELHIKQQEFLLELAKTASRPSIEIHRADYMSVTEREYVISEVTE